MRKKIIRRKLTSPSWTVRISIVVGVLTILMIVAKSPENVEKTYGEVVGNYNLNNKFGNQLFLQVKLKDGKTVHIKIDDNVPVKMGTHVSLTVTTSYGIFKRYYLNTYPPAPSIPALSARNNRQTGP